MTQGRAAPPPPPSLSCCPWLGDTLCCLGKHLQVRVCLLRSPSVTRRGDVVPWRGEKIHAVAGGVSLPLANCCPLPAVEIQLTWLICSDPSGHSETWRRFGLVSRNSARGWVRRRFFAEFTRFLRFPCLCFQQAGRCQLREPTSPWRPSPSWPGPGLVQGFLGRFSQRGDGSECRPPRESEQSSGSAGVFRKWVLGGCCWGQGWCHGPWPWAVPQVTGLVNSTVGNTYLHFPCLRPAK